jgi:gamma-glutamylcyclotransferase
MLLERLQHRCPSAQTAGAAIAHGYEIEFSKISNDTSGKATLNNTNASKEGAYGVLFTLQRDDLAKLDQAEGLGFGYDRIDDFIVKRLVDDELVKAKTYLAPPTYLDGGLIPFDWYLGLVVAGAEQNGLPDCYVRDLRAVSSIIDPQLDRKSRVEATGILSRVENRNTGE